MHNIEIKYSNFNFTNTAYQSAQNLSHIASNKIIAAMQSKDPLYQIFSIEHALAQAALAAPYAQKINQTFTNLIIIGMGGAILNPETLISLSASQTKKIKLHFLNNTDPIFLRNLLSQITTLQNCAVLAISNSGETY